MKLYATYVLAVGLLVGMLLGSLLTLGVIEAFDNRYTYYILPPADCAVKREAEVVPNQPNPCQFRYARW